MLKIIKQTKKASGKQNSVLNPFSLGEGLIKSCNYKLAILYLTPEGKNGEGNGELLPFERQANKMNKPLTYRFITLIRGHNGLLKKASQLSRYP